MQYFPIIFLLLYIQTLFAQNNDFNYPSDYAIMAHRMVDVMDDIAAPITKPNQAYRHAPQWGINLPNKQSANKLEQQNYWMRTTNPYAWTEPHQRNNADFPSHQWLPTPPQGIQALEQFLTILDGSWQGTGKDILIIRGDRFRIYMNPKQFRDGYIAVKGNQLTMTIPHEGKPKTFEFAEFNGQLALRNSQGVIIRYKLISKH